MNRITLSPRVRTAALLVYCVAHGMLVVLTHFTMRLSHLIPFLLPLALLEDDVKRFLIQWSPFYAVILFYDAFRGIADELGSRVDFWTLPVVERAWFGGVLPTVWLQQHLGAWLHGWAGTLLTGVYFGHFLLPIAVFYVFWRRNYPAFRLATRTIALLSVFGFLTFLIYPAAPPWLASRAGVIPHVEHILLDELREMFSGTRIPSVYIRLNPNPVAPFPSLHAGYPLVLWLCVREYAPRWQGLFLLNAAAVAFTIVAFGEHYVVDIVAGWVYAVASFYLVREGLAPPRAPKRR
jgi:hypothetical protein